MPRWTYLLPLLTSLLFGQEASPPATSTPPANPQEIVRRAAMNDLDNDQKQRSYTYIQHTLQKKLTGKGEIQSAETKTHEIMVLYGEQVERLIEKNDQPLPPKDAEKEERRINDLTEKWKNESEEKRAKRLEKHEKERNEERAFVEEIPNAFTFTQLPDETLRGRDTFVIVADPKPGYEPHTRDARFLAKFRFKVWVDKTEYQWVRLEAKATDTISWGLFLARVHKGTRFELDQIRVNDEVWLPQTFHALLDIRVALVKNFNYDVTADFHDYKKFRSETRITGAGEVNPP
jgi:hypothetical protein